ncbi:MAG: sugar ABC transporter permease [Bacteroidetes bacterium]|nr:sugar ABC transporter permease [Bacteroidota bacterium]
MIKQLFQSRLAFVIIALIIIAIGFNLVTDGLFLSPRNFTNLMRQTSVVGLLACGMVLVIVAGEIDLSVGSAVALCGGFAAISNCLFQLSPIAAVVAAMLGGLAIGAINGCLVAYTRIPAFIVTLGGLLIYRGLIKGVTKGETIGPIADSIQQFGIGFLPSYVAWIVLVLFSSLSLFGIYQAMKAKKNVIPAVLGLLTTLAFAAMLFSYKGIPAQVLLLAVVALLVHLVSTKFPFGRHVYAIGGNREAAFYSGINIREHVLYIYLLLGGMIGLASIVYTAQLGSATPGAARNLELDAIAACVIGGCSLMGGRGTIAGALCGALMMASLDNGMSLLNVQDFLQDIIKGLILVGAVALDMAPMAAKARR